MTTYVLVNKPCDDYSSIDGTLTFIFNKVETFTKEAAPYWNKLCAVCDKMQDGDAIIFNGPSWLIALAGHAAMTANCTITLMCYNKETAKYESVEF